MHQLDRMEEMLTRIAANFPSDDAHRHKADVTAHAVELFNALLQGRKIEAIKAYRWLTGLGLKESKDAVELVMNRFQRDAA